MNFPIGGSTSKAAPKMLHCKGFVAGFYLVWYVFPVCFVPICLWPAFILEHNTYITQPGQSQQIEFSSDKDDWPQLESQKSNQEVKGIHRWIFNMFQKETHKVLPNQALLR